MMRAVIVVAKSHLSIMHAMINQQNVQIVAIVTDDRIFASEHVYPNKIVFGFWQLEDVIKKFLPDYVLFIGKFFRELRNFKSALRTTGYMNRFFDLSNFGNIESFELLSHFSKLESNQFKIFVTGISYTNMAIDPRQFSLPLINCACYSQDLYYDFRIAEKIVKKSAPPPRKISEGFRYALIGLAPYSLHYDLSKCSWESFRMTRYFFALHDLHNSWIDFELLRSFIKSDFVKSIEERARDFNINLPNGNDIMTFESALIAREQIDEWKPKYYPETVAENKQILEKYLKLLELSEIFPILFLPPMMKEYQDEFCKEKIDELFSFLYDLMKSYRFTLINGWKMPNFIDHDFRDINHLNINGARKFSAKLNEIIMKLETQR